PRRSAGCGSAGSAGSASRTWSHGSRPTTGFGLSGSVHWMTSSTNWHARRRAMSSTAGSERNPVKIGQTSDREGVVTRGFDAPARLVFEAWTKPELFKQWWVPASTGMKLHEIEMDVRTGGRYRLNFGEGMDFVGTYVEVTPYSRIVWTNEEGGEDGSVTTV